MLVEQLGNCTLIQGDAREYVRDAIETDAIIIDPVWPNVPAGMFPVDDPYDLLKETLLRAEAKRLVIIMRFDSDPRFLQAVPSWWKFFRVQYLPYAVPGYKGRKLGGMELAYCFGEPIPNQRGQRVIPGEAPKAMPGDNIKEHPCNRNLEHMRWLLRWWSMPGETVTDLFMGSGTTGVAAVQLGRRFVGVEIDPGYYAIAKRRILDALARPRLFDDAPWRDPATQTKLFTEG